MMLFNVFFCRFYLGKPQRKVPPLVARPLRLGGGLKAGPLRKKTFFDTYFFDKEKQRVPIATNLEGEGG